MPESIDDLIDRYLAERWSEYPVAATSVGIDGYDGKPHLDASLASPIFVERAIGQCRAAITYARTMVPAEVSDPDDRARLVEAGERAARAYEDFLDFLRKLLADASGPFAIGEERYSALLLEKERLSYGAPEMRERGRAAFAEIDVDMARRANNLRGTKDWRVVVEEVHQDLPPTPT